MIFCYADVASREGQRISLQANVLRPAAYGTLGFSCIFCLAATPLIKRLYEWRAAALMDPVVFSSAMMILSLLLSLRDVCRWPWLLR